MTDTLATIPIGSIFIFGHCNAFCSRCQFCYIFLKDTYISYMCYNCHMDWKFLSTTFSVPVTLPPLIEI